jgi:hypothetical protein
MTAKARTPEGDRLDVLVTLIEAYERQHFPRSCIWAWVFLRRACSDRARQRPHAEASAMAGHASGAPGCRSRLRLFTLPT